MTDQSDNAEKQSPGKETIDSANNRLSSVPSTVVESKNSQGDHHWSWAHYGLALLLVILCVSAGLLWYRIYVLHSHFELRLMTGDFVDDRLKPAVRSLYSPQVIITA